MITKKTVSKIAISLLTIGGFLLIQRHFTYALDLSGVTGSSQPITLDDGIRKGNELGRKIWFMVRLAGFWICVVYGGFQIIKEITQGDIKEVVKVAVKYILGLAILVFFFDVLTMVLNLA